MTRNRRVLISCRQMLDVYDHFATELKDAAVDADLAEGPGQSLSEADLMPVIDRYHGVIAGDDAFTRAVLRRADRLSVVSKWGIGTDSIDLDAAAELGIAVTNTPGMFNDEVADVTIGYLVMLARGLHVIDTRMRDGEWCKVRGRSLAGLTLGVVGLGGIGRATARRALAMGMSVIGTDPSVQAGLAATRLGVRVVDRTELLRGSDAIALNCPLSADTHHLIDAAALAATRPGLLLVNTGRGPLVHEASLVAALQAGRVAGVALDVFEVEPLPAGSPLRGRADVILGSHNASNTVQAGLRASALAVANLLAHLPEAVVR